MVLTEEFNIGDIKKTLVLIKETCIYFLMNFRTEFLESKDMGI